MARKDNLGDLLASDDEVDALKPRHRLTETVEKKVTIVLEENDNIPPTGQFISLNGRTWMLRPGEPAEVPMGLVNILNDAVQAVPQIDPSTNQVIAYRKRLRFPFRIVQPDPA